jgi:hypothetical protein
MQRQGARTQSAILDARHRIFGCAPCLAGFGTIALRCPAGAFLIFSQRNLEKPARRGQESAASGRRSATVSTIPNSVRQPDKHNSTNQLL